MTERHNSGDQVPREEVSGADAAGQALPAPMAETLGEALLEGKSLDRTLELTVRPERIAQVCAYLAAAEGGGYNYLASLTAVDWIGEGQIEVVYHAYRLGTTERVIVRLRVDREGALVPTVTDVWAAANWKEREVAEMFGVQFEGHPDPRLLLLPEDWTGVHPLRKDFVEPEHPWRAPSPLHDPPTGEKSERNG